MRLTTRRVFVAPRTLESEAGDAVRGDLTDVRQYCPDPHLLDERLFDALIVAGDHSDALAASDTALDVAGTIDPRRPQHAHIHGL